MAVGVQAWGQNCGNHVISEAGVILGGCPASAPTGITAAHGVAMVPSTATAKDHATERVTPHATQPSRSSPHGDNPIHQRPHTRLFAAPAPHPSPKHMRLHNPLRRAHAGHQHRTPPPMRACLTRPRTFFALPPLPSRKWMTAQLQRTSHTETPQYRRWYRPRSTLCGPCGGGGLRVHP